jgi:putative transcriptional regulator
MATGKTLKDVRPLGAATKARLAAMTPGEIERNAIEDEDNPPLSETELERVRAARIVQRIRKTTGLSQEKFADTFRINRGRLRDWEQGRTAPDSAALAYLTVIEREPEVVRRALKDARE